MANSEPVPEGDDGPEAGDGAVEEKERGDSACVAPPIELDEEEPASWSFSLLEMLTLPVGRSRAKLEVGALVADRSAPREDGLELDWRTLVELNVG